MARLNTVIDESIRRKVKQLAKAGDHSFDDEIRSALKEYVYMREHLNNGGGIEFIDKEGIIVLALKL